MTRRRSFRVLALAAFALHGCTTGERPEPPAIARDVARIGLDGQFAQPQVPGHRTTMDGRVALRVQGGPRDLSFYLFVPEKLGEPILTGPAGTQILASTDPVRVPLPVNYDPSVTAIGHAAICDPTEEFAQPGERPNPYPCGSDSHDDCYDITIASTTAVGLVTQFWGTPATVQVAEPKTAGAHITRVELGESVRGGTLALTNDWTEAAITRDGRLLTGRFGGAPRAWTNPTTGETKIRYYDLGYAVLPEGAAPCDVTGWTTFHPMSHAPFDPEMIGRYGLAAYPFRDSEGQPIPDGEDMGGSYPWVDREGTNVFMTGVPGRVSEQSPTLYPRRCLIDGCESYPEPIDWDRGYLVAGLWTHGKLVHLDGLINNVDWAVGISPTMHYLVDLYRDASGADVSVHVGGGRAGAREGGPPPAGYSGNANILDSLQNLPNHDHEATPITPRDVVWLMGTGVGTDEIAFDDYVDPNAFLLSNMQASITQYRDAAGATIGVPHYWNGQLRWPIVPTRLPDFNVLLFPDAADEIHIQNAATSLGWNVPAYGRVAAGTGRVEPVASGGIKGKGFWLSGQNPIHYDVPAQTKDVLASDWYVGVFVDPRASDSEPRVLARFPDGTSIRMRGRAAVDYLADGSLLHTVVLPPSEAGWIHLAWRLREGNREVSLFHDGFALDRYAAAGPLFAVTEGDLAIGADDGDAAGYRGWIDELEIFAHAPDLEVACNHAEGTLVALDGGAQPGAEDAAYPAWAHDAVAAAAGEAAGGRFACFHDYSRDYAANLANLPAGTRSLRRAIHFPEGPLVASLPRPDSSANAFCRTCHTEHGKGGLSLAALAYDAGTTAENDPRRPPMQPPRRVFGNIPAGWIPAGPGPGSPAQATQAPAEGALIDRWVLPESRAAAARRASNEWVHRH